MASDNPVDAGHKLADTDEADGGHKEVEEVEAIVRLVGRLSHFLIKVVKYQRDI